MTKPASNTQIHAKPVAHANPVYAEIDFPALPTLTTDERLKLAFEHPVALHIAWRIDEVVGVLAAIEAASNRGHWCVGFVGYESAAAFDWAMVTHLAANIDETPPLAWFAEFAAPVFLQKDEADTAFHVGQWQTDTDNAAFAQKVEAIRADIREGRFYQVNLTTRLQADFSGDAKQFYRALQRAQPNGYHAFFDMGGGTNTQLLSVSPELFFTMRDGIITTQPMKGTAPRGDTPAEDVAIAEALTHSEKERAENLMIVDLLRNDLSRIAKPGSVDVPHLFSLHALPSVWQMTSTVRAAVREGVGLKEVFAALFPCGSITGAPKVEAMRAIHELETSPRGAYCGAIGYVAPNGVACFNVGIRSVWIANAYGKRQAICGVGGGITFDSTVEGEAAEVAYKSRFVKRASAPFDLFETIRLQDGKYTLLERHLDRIEKSAQHFRFKSDRPAMVLSLNRLKSQYPRGVWRVKLLSRANGDFSVNAAALNDMPAAPRVQLALRAISSSDEFLAHKTTRRETYDALAPTDAEVFDTLLLNERGELTEFTRANVFLQFGGTLVTPPTSSGLLNGTLRDQWLVEGKAVEKILRVEDLPKADAVFWGNGLRGMIEVFLTTENV